MKILLLIRNMSDISNDDIIEAISNLQFTKLYDIYDLRVISSDDHYHFPLESLIDVVQVYSDDADEVDNKLAIQAEMYRDINTYISSKYPKYIADYLVDEDYYSPYVGCKDFLMINFVSGKEIIKNMISNDKLKEKYDIIHTIKIGNLIDDGFYDIKINAFEGLKNISIDLDMLFDKIKEEYSNAKC